MVGRLADLFRGSSVAAYDRRIRSRLAAGDVEEAQRLLAKALGRHPFARSLADLKLMVERAHARDELRDLERRITAVGDPRAYERLVQRYDALGLAEEARRTRQAFLAAHPDLDTPHLLLGEAHLKEFYEDLLARDGHDAQEHLQRAARLNPQALKPRLLLAELYYCVDARRPLALVRAALERFAGDEASLANVFEAIDEVADPEAPLTMDGVLERIEVEGQLPREPSQWPLATPRAKEARLEEERAVRAAREAVRRKDAEEVVVLRRNGTLLVHAGGPAEGADEDAGLVAVIRAVARTVTTQAREFDLGRFQRCVLDGAFGLVICGRWHGVIAAARRANRQEPLLAWERLCRRLDGAAVEEAA